MHTFMKEKSGIILIFIITQKYIMHETEIMFVKGKGKFQGQCPEDSPQAVISLANLLKKSPKKPKKRGGSHMGI